MRTYKEVTKTVKHVDKVFCDVCKKEGKAEGEGTQWTQDYSDHSKTCVYIESGFRGRDYGDIDTVRFDLCPECLKKFITIEGNRSNVVY